MITPMQYVEHHRARAKVERDAIPDVESVKAFDRLSKTTILDMLHPNDGTIRTPSTHFGVGIKETGGKDCRKPVYVGNMVNECHTELWQALVYHILGDTTEEE